MNRRFLSVLTAVLLLTPASGGCSKKVSENQSETLKIGMVTDAGTIDDKSINQSTWEGIVKAGKGFSLETKYLKPSGATEENYLKEIANLYNAGFRMIVTPGEKFSFAIGKAQTQYPDCKFVLIDAAPKDETGTVVIAPNTVSITFAEQESGFIAGLAMALQLQTGDVGFLGGKELPAVQRYNWGFQQGIRYANENLGTGISMKSENFVYQGSFDNVSAGRQLAAQMYDRGVECIFAAAGQVGVGAINEAKARRTKGMDVWIVGVDVDQYAGDIYNDKDSSLLTSAVKKMSVAAYELVKKAVDGKFPGGKALTFDAKSGGVGLPVENPNLSKETVEKAAEVLKKVASGDITVSSEQGDLIR